MPLGDFAGAHAVDQPGGHSDGQKPRDTVEYPSATRVRSAAAEWWGGSPPCEGERMGRRGVCGSAQLARDHDVAGAQALGLLQRQGAVGFEIVAQAPFAVDPNAVARRRAAQRFGKLGGSPPSAGS